MEALKNSLATLVALEARIYDLIDPATQIAEAVKAVVKEAVVVIERFEARLAALEAHPALSVPALEAPAKTEAPVGSSKEFEIVGGNVVDAPKGILITSAAVEPPAQTVTTVQAASGDAPA